MIRTYRQAIARTLPRAGNHGQPAAEKMTKKRRRLPEKTTAFVAIVRPFFPRKHPWKVQPYPHFPRRQGNSTTLSINPRPPEMGGSVIPKPLITGLPDSTRTRPRQVHVEPGPIFDPEFLTLPGASRRWPGPARRPLSSGPSGRSHSGTLRKHDGSNAWPGRATQSKPSRRQGLRPR